MKFKGKEERKYGFLFEIKGLGRARSLSVDEQMHIAWQGKTLFWSALCLLIWVSVPGIQADRCEPLPGSLLVHLAFLNDLLQRDNILHSESPHRTQRQGGKATPEVWGVQDSFSLRS